MFSSCLAIFIISVSGTGTRLKVSKMTTSPFILRPTWKEDLHFTAMRHCLNFIVGEIIMSSISSNCARKLMFNLKSHDHPDDIITENHSIQRNERITGMPANRPNDNGDKMGKKINGSNVLIIPSATHFFENGRMACVPYALKISTNT